MVAAIAVAWGRIHNCARTLGSVIDLHASDQATSRELKIKREVILL